MVSNWIQKPIFSVVFTLISCLIISACTDDGAHRPIPDEFTQGTSGSGSGVSFATVKPIFEANCKGCHHAWEKDEQYTTSQKQAIYDAVINSKPLPMPLGGSLSEGDKEAISKWALSTGSSTSSSAADCPQPELPPVEAAIQSCAKCHGVDGDSKIPEVPSIASQSLLYMKTQLEQFADGSRKDTNMNGQMNAVARKLFADLTDDEINEVLTHYAGNLIVPDEKRPMQADEQELFDLGSNNSTSCKSCHLNDQNHSSTSPAMPFLAGQDAEYLEKQLLQFKSNERQSQFMYNMVKNLTDDELRALAFYFSALAPPTVDATDH